MKRNLEKEIEDILTDVATSESPFLEMEGNKKKLLSLFSDTFDDVIEQAKPIYINRGNTVGDRKAGREEATKEYEQNLRARKKGVGL